MSDEETAPLPSPRSRSRYRRPSPGLLVLFSQYPVAGEGRYPARTEMEVGRADDNLIRIKDRHISRTHAVIRFNDSGATVFDAGSSGGTFLNQERVVQPVPFKPGAVLRCGSTLMTVVPDVEAFEGWRRWGLDEPLVGGPAMRALRAEVHRHASSTQAVMITGETGTGKERVASFFHALTGAGPLEVVNCAAIPANMFEAELFGVTRGAFTGAESDRDGLFVKAHGGVLFLDEVTEIPAECQAKLLRAVEQKEVRRLGDSRARRADVRIISATNRDIQAELDRGAFRTDLFYRLCGVSILVPPLRDRMEDIPLLVDYFLRQDNPRFEKVRRGRGHVPQPSVLLMERLLLHGWPGNVRELFTVLENAVHNAIHDRARYLELEHLDHKVLDATAPGEDLKVRIVELLRQTGGNISQTARSLGMSRATLHRRCEKLKIDIGAYRSNSAQ